MTCLIGQGVKDHALPVPIILFKMRKTAPAMPIFLCSGTTYVVPYSSDVWLAASLSLLALFRRFLSDGPSMANDDVSESIITRPKSDASARKNVRFVLDLCFTWASTAMWRAGLFGQLRGEDFLKWQLLRCVVGRPETRWETTK